MKRHVTTLIPYLTKNNNYVNQSDIINSNSKEISVTNQGLACAATMDCKQKLKLLMIKPPSSLYCIYCNIYTQSVRELEHISIKYF